MRFHVAPRVLSTDLKAFEQRLIECVEFARTCTRKWIGEQVYTGIVEKKNGLTIL